MTMRLKIDKLNFLIYLKLLKLDIILVILLIGSLELSGCANTTTTKAPNISNLNSTNPVVSCRSFFVTLNQSIIKAGVADNQSNQIPDFPYLRVNRFLASYKTSNLDDNQFNFWVSKLQDLANKTYRVEINNLPQLPKQFEASLSKYSDQRKILITTVNYCSNILKHNALINTDQRNLLQHTVSVPSDYILWQRILGIYPLTFIPMVIAVQKGQNDSIDTFKIPLAQLKTKGQLTRYITSQLNSESTSQIETIIAQATQNPLHIPLPSPQATQILFNTFAPIWEIDVANNEDKIGKVAWAKNGKLPEIITNSPTTYQYISYNFWGNNVLLQLNYIIWFPSRPKTSAFDLLGGNLDSLIWRVTLLPNGVPLVYDSIHGCGCYREFFPTQALQPINAIRNLTVDEKAFVPQKAPELLRGQHTVIRIASLTHYIERVYADSPTQATSASSTLTIPYVWLPYNNLRSLPRADGSNMDLFPPNGIISETKRNERYLLWPMGVPAPGSMREWGHHATSFAGQSFYDDPFLLEENFESKNISNR